MKMKEMIELNRTDYNGTQHTHIIVIDDDGESFIANIMRNLAYYSPQLLLGIWVCYWNRENISSFFRRKKKGESNSRMMLIVDDGRKERSTEYMEHMTNVYTENTK